MADDINKQTLPEQIYQILRKDILNQEIPCGAKLTLQSLKDRFGVSHTPIREALTRLVEDNLVTYYSNVGISVVSLKEKDIREIFSLSYELDCVAIKLAFENGHGDTLLTELGANVKKCGELLASGRTRQWGDASDQFHLALYNHAGNSRLNTAALKLRAQTSLIYNLYQVESQNCQSIQAHHDAIYAALCQTDFLAAFEALKAHLQSDMETALGLYKAQLESRGA